MKVIIGPLIGAWAGSLVAAVSIGGYWRFRRWTAKRNPAYPQFVRYQEALAAHRQYLLAVQNELNRQDEEKQEQLRAQERAREEQRRRELSWWMALDGQTFEHELARHFRNAGYRVLSTGRAGDQGVDIILTKGQRKIIVQCKAHRHYISPSVIRDLYGTLLHHHANEAWLVTTGGFHKGSKAFAKGKPIRLLTMREILGWQRTIGSGQTPGGSEE